MEKDKGKQTAAEKDVVEKFGMREDNPELGIVSRPVDLWRGTLQSASTRTGALFLFFKQNGGEAVAESKIASCFTIPAVVGNFIVHGFIHYEIDFNTRRGKSFSRMFKAMRVVGSTKLTDELKLLFSEVPDTKSVFLSFHKIKRMTLSLTEKFKQIINPKEPITIVFAHWINTEIIGAMNAIADIMSRTKEWEGAADRWVQLFSGVLLSDDKSNKDRAAMKGHELRLYKTYKITINDVDYVTLKATKYPLKIDEHSGCRKKAKFIYMLTEVLGLPTGFPGLFEWMDTVDSLPIAKWVTSIEDPKTLSATTDTLEMIAEIVEECKHYILVANMKADTSGEVKLSPYRLGEMLAIAVIRACALIVMEHSFWNQEIEESNMPWNRDVVEIALPYKVAGTPEGLITYDKYMRDELEHSGYDYPPKEEEASKDSISDTSKPTDTSMTAHAGGTEIFNCMLDIGETLKCYRYFTMPWIGITGKKNCELESTVIDSYDYWDDIAKKYYPMKKCSIDLDGCIIPTGWNDTGVFILSEVFDFIKLRYRKEYMEKPQIKLSIIGIIDSWFTTLEALGISGCYAAIAFFPRYSGKIFPLYVDKNSVKGYMKQEGNLLNKLEDVMLKLLGKFEAKLADIKSTITKAFTEEKGDEKSAK